MVKLVKLCAHPDGCPRPARGRGLCLSHYSEKWKVSDLPLLEPKELLVRHKLYLTREQTLKAKRLAGEAKQKTSAYLRAVINEFLKHFPDAS